LLRGDVRFGNEPIMHEAEQRGLAYLFKLRLIANVKRAIERLASGREWVDAGQGWQAKESAVRLARSSRQRRIIVRRRVKGALAASTRRMFWRAAASPRASSRCFTIDGTPSFFWPNRTGIGRRFTSPAQLLHAIATRSRRARQTTLTIASSHAKSIPAAKALRTVAMFLRALVKAAEQLAASQRWAAILARVFQAFRPLRLPPHLAPS